MISTMNSNKPELKQLPVDQIQRGQYQPRKQFNQEALEELAQSIKSSGLLQPIVVRPLNEDTYEIVAGERRWRATQIAGLDTINCLVKRYSDEQAAEAAAIENINRVNLNAIEEAKAYQRLIDEFSYIHDEIAAALGKSRAKITNALRLLKLAPDIQELIIEGRLSEGHGKVLASLPYTQQRELTHKALSRAWSVRKIELEVKKLAQNANKNTTKQDTNIKYLERIMSDTIGCNTTIDYEDDKGQLKIDFHNLDILQGILKKLGYDEKI